MNRDETEIDYDLLIQQIRDEQIWQIRDWQNEILDQWEGPYGCMGPNQRNAGKALKKNSGSQVCELD